MNFGNLKNLIVSLLSIFLILLVLNCSSDNSDTTTNPTITINGLVTDFGNIDVLSHSDSQNVLIQGTDLTGEINVFATTNFEVSTNNTNFSNQANINNNTNLYIRFSPQVSSTGIINGIITLQSENATSITINVRGTGISIEPMLSASTTNINFTDTNVMETSESTSFTVVGNNLESGYTLDVTQGFEISLDNVAFSNSLQILLANANAETLIYSRFAPTSAGNLSGTLSIVNTDTEVVEISLTGTGLPVIHNYPTFNNQRIAFGGGFNQTETANFNLHSDNSNIETIKMYIKLRCPAGGCNAWDVYANIKVKDITTNDWFEIGRYITPYGVDNSQISRGFEIDVTDFKSLLVGNTELFARIETWGSDGWELSVDFDYIEGTPDYPYYAVSKILGYDDWSTSGVPYGTAHTFDLTKTITIPSNTESTHLRTIISGWGHATPVDSDNRPCAEWCFRTHDILINGTSNFQHNMQPIGCASNLVNPQNGNWSSDRAGWCPGMAVPVRIDSFNTAMANSTFSFEYQYENWTADGGSTSGNAGAYYATSTFVIVKSNTPIVSPTVID